MYRMARSPLWYDGVAAPPRRLPVSSRSRCRVLYIAARGERDGTRACRLPQPEPEHEAFGAEQEDGGAVAARGHAERRREQAAVAKAAEDAGELQHHERGHD